VQNAAWDACASVPLPTLGCTARCTCAHASHTLCYTARDSAATRACGRAGVHLTHTENKEDTLRWSLDRLTRSSKHVIDIIVTRRHKRLTRHRHVIRVGASSVARTGGQRTHRTPWEDRVESCSRDATSTTRRHYEWRSVKRVKHHASAAVKGVKIAPPNISGWVPRPSKLAVRLGAKRVGAKWVGAERVGAKRVSSEWVCC
jgi:hypothetical protein